MRIKIAKQVGFCFGVKRAINIATETLDTSKVKQDIYSLGAIIHNPQVVESLLNKGLKVVNSIEAIDKGTVIISSHGAPLEVINKIKKKKLKLVDATCPFVKHAHSLIEGLKKEGYRIIVIGDKHHPEVKALLSLAGSGGEKGKIGVISQTTQSKANYLKEISVILEKDFKEVRIFNTICNDTRRRQELARKLLKECDAMVVVGGKNSANTRRLWQICKESGVSSLHIETDSELRKRFFSGKKLIGIASGASTPESMVRKVVDKIKKITKN